MRVCGQVRVCESRDEMSTELTVNNSIAAQPAADIMSVISRAASDPNFSAESMKTLWEIKREMDAQERKERFEAALARVQKQAPVISKDGLMDRGAGKGQIKYASFENVDAHMRPIYQAEGFTVTWDGPLVDGRIRVVGKFTAHGHTEEREYHCPPDTSGGKQNPQAVGSTISYGKRYLSIMFWNVRVEGEDTNGAPSKQSEAITEEQELKLQDALNDFPKPDAARQSFLRTFGISAVKELRQSQYEDAKKRIEAARKGTR